MGFWSYSLVTLHVFGTYWLMVVLNNLNDFVCSGIAVNEYFSKKEIKNSHIFCHTLGHHVGTIAWSIILLPVLFFKAIFGWIDFLLTSDNPNTLQRTLSNKLSCCCNVYNNLVDQFNENYFTISYLGSENFFPSNKRFFYLTEAYSDLSYSLFLLSSMYGLFGKCVVAMLTTFLAYLCYLNS